MDRGKEVDNDGEGGEKKRGRWVRGSSEMFKVLRAALPMSVEEIGS